MEKFHMYDQIASSTHSQVYKGRLKMSIEYVAIKRVDKSRMDSVVTEVQAIHRLCSPNVLKFHDWYETRNNVWLILEYCAGGSLKSLIEQDGGEPESAVRLFGVDLMAGLQHVHAAGLLHCDLRPANILVDEYGILKLSGFSCAQKIASLKPLASPGSSASAPGSRSGGRQQEQASNYAAPELFLRQFSHSFASDFWSLGCLLLELRTGTPAFDAALLPDVVQSIMDREPGGLAELEEGGLCDLIRALLDKPAANTTVSAS
ncbi:kinase-like domain-containing protein [Tribonema minus]|uniref:Kinase-like domain-containing protein n=1 Tax=Tribonema minus TaxID=303371 RepID=A0A835YVB9_9STRA|nr:kinase-like domain-containing protein [Tribonema minus]